MRTVGIVSMALVLVFSTAVPVYAGEVERMPVSVEEDGVLAAQAEATDVQALEIVAGDEGTAIWAGVGVTLVVLILLGAAASGG